MRRRAFAVLPLLAACAALAAGLGDVPRAAVLLAGLCAAAALEAAFGPDAPPAWLSAAAAFSAASAARLLGLWGADPALGFALTAAAAAAGAAVGAAGAAPGADGALAWAAAAGVLVAAEPSLVRFLGQNSAEPKRLFFPTEGGAFFLVGQPALLMAAAAAAFARAARGLARPARAVERLAAAGGALLAAALIPCAGPSAALGAAGGALALAAVARARPWARGLKTLEARLLAASAVAALVFAAASPRALLEAWTSRLDSLYPGGSFLAAADDGAASWAAYRFSRGERVLLRDGVIQRDDAVASLLALDSALGQKTRLRCSVLLVRPPGPQTVFAASRACGVAVQDGRPAEAKALDAELGDGWRRRLLPEDGTFDAILTVLPLPFDRSARRLVADARLSALRARLAGDGAAAFVLPSFAADAEALEAVRKSAAAVFGAARAGVLPTGDGLVLAAARAPLLDGETLFLNVPATGRPDEQALTRKLLAQIRWLPDPAAK